MMIGMKFEKNFKNLIWIGTLSCVGLLLGIVMSQSIHQSIGASAILGSSIGYFLGACVAFVSNKISKKNNRYI